MRISSIWIQNSGVSNGAGKRLILRTMEHSPVVPFMEMWDENESKDLQPSWQNVRPVTWTSVCQVQWRIFVPVLLSSFLTSDTVGFLFLEKFPGNFSDPTSLMAVHYFCSSSFSGFILINGVPFDPPLSSFHMLSLESRIMALKFSPQPKLSFKSHSHILNLLVHICWPMGTWHPIHVFLCLPLKHLLLLQHLPAQGATASTQIPNPETQDSMEIPLFPPRLTSKQSQALQFYRLGIS